MPHDPTLITTIAMALAVAWLLGLVTHKVGLSPIVGYLLAGVVVGPYTPGFVADIGLASQLAELGVTLLMFGVGLHFKLADLWAVRGIAVTGALVQSATATLAGLWIARGFGWPWSAGLMLGLACSVASTVVLTRALEERGLLTTRPGHVALGWLLVQDVLTVIVLVLLPVVAEARLPDAAAWSPASLMRPVLFALLELALLVVLVLGVGARLIPRLMEAVARTRSRELFTLTVLVVALGVATGAARFFGVSMALGAFLAGMVVAQSAVSQQAAAEALPLRDAFAVLFFVSAGMLFDPMLPLREPLLVLACLGIVLIVNPLTALVLAAVLGHSARTGLVLALGLAQIGEFSFMLAALGQRYELLPAHGVGLVVACALPAITLNALLMRSLDTVERGLRRWPWVWRLLNDQAERRQDAVNAETVAALQAEAVPVIVVGYGPVGRSVDRLLRQAGLSTVVIDINLDTVAELTQAGRRALYGDASRAEVLKQAGAARASHMVITLPHSQNRAPSISAARELNPALRIFVRARYLRERRELEQAGATGACFEELEAAVALARALLDEIGADPATIEREAAAVRAALAPGPLALDQPVN
jgi:CPA2 family monovalent cation:H+ antiporter-2